METEHAAPLKWSDVDCLVCPLNTVCQHYTGVIGNVEPETPFCVRFRTPSAAMRYQCEEVAD